MFAPSDLWSRLWQAFSPVSLHSEISNRTWVTIWDRWPRTPRWTILTWQQLIQIYSQLLFQVSNELYLLSWTIPRSYASDGVGIAGAPVIRRVGWHWLQTNQHSRLQNLRKTDWHSVITTQVALKKVSVRIMTHTCIVKTIFATCRGGFYASCGSILCKATA